MEKIISVYRINIGLLSAIGMWILTGCAPQGEELMIHHAASTPYAHGYSDGCESGRKQAGITNATPHKDPAQYQKIKDYKNGWDTGFRECKFREERVAKLPQKP